MHTRTHLLSHSLSFPPSPFLLLPLLPPTPCSELSAVGYNPQKGQWKAIRPVKEQMYACIFVHPNSHGHTHIYTHRQACTHAHACTHTHTLCLLSLLPLSISLS